MTSSLVAPAWIWQAGGTPHLFSVSPRAAINRRWSPLYVQTGHRLCHPNESGGDVFFKRRRNAEYALCISTRHLFAEMEMAPPSCVAQRWNLFVMLLHSSGTRGDIHGLGYLYGAEPPSSFQSDGFLRSSVLDSSLLGAALLHGD